MNQKELDDLKAFIFVLVQKSVDYELNPNRDNLKLLKLLTNSFYLSLSKKAKNEFRDNIRTILENIKKGFEKLNEIEIKKENEKPLSLYLLEKQIKELKRDL